MIVEGNSYLMMIEPKGSESEVNDELTEMAKKIWFNCVNNQVLFRGWHTCTGCRSANSDNAGWITPKGRLTNSLLVHYVMCHRSEISGVEIEKLKEEYYNMEGKKNAD